MQYKTCWFFVLFFNLFNLGINKHSFIKQNIQSFHFHFMPSSCFCFCEDISAMEVYGAMCDKERCEKNYERWIQTPTAAWRGPLLPHGTPSCCYFWGDWVFTCGWTSAHAAMFFQTACMYMIIGAAPRPLKWVESPGLAAGGVGGHSGPPGEAEDAGGDPERARRGKHPAAPAPVSGEGTNSRNCSQVSDWSQW